MVYPGKLSDVHPIRVPLIPSDVSRQALRRASNTCTSHIVWCIPASSPTCIQYVCLSYRLVYPGKLSDVHPIFVPLIPSGVSRQALRRASNTCAFHSVWCIPASSPTCIQYMYLSYRLVYPSKLSDVHPIHVPLIPSGVSRQALRRASNTCTSHTVWCIPASSPTCIQYVCLSYRLVYPGKLSDVHPIFVPLIPSGVSRQAFRRSSNTCTSHTVWCIPASYPTCIQYLYLSYRLVYPGKLSDVHPLRVPLIPSGVSRQALRRASNTCTSHTVWCIPASSPTCIQYLYLSYRLVYPGKLSDVHPIRVLFIASGVSQQVLPLASNTCTSHSHTVWCIPASSPTCIQYMYLSYRLVYPSKVSNVHPIHVPLIPSGVSRQALRRASNTCTSHTVWCISASLRRASNTCTSHTVWCIPASSPTCIQYVCISYRLVYPGKLSDVHPIFVPLIPSGVSRQALRRASNTCAFHSVWCIPASSPTCIQYMYLSYRLVYPSKLSDVHPIHVPLIPSGVSQQGLRRASQTCTSHTVWCIPASSPTGIQYMYLSYRLVYPGKLSDVHPIRVPLIPSGVSRQALRRASNTCASHTVWCIPASSPT